MHDDEPQPSPSPTPAPPRAARRRAARLASPAGLILAGLCLLLPFLSASCASEEQPRLRWEVTYTGVDVVTGGRPDLAFTRDADQEPIHRLDDAEERDLLSEPAGPLPPQPVAWLAVALMAATLAATAWRSPTWRVTATAGLALASAVVLGGAAVLARRDVTDAVAAVLIRFGSSPPEPRATVAELRQWDMYPQVSDMVHYGYGFWAAVTVLAAVGTANTVAVLRDPRL